MDKKYLGEVVKTFIALSKEFHELKDEVGAMRGEVTQLREKEVSRVNDDNLINGMIEEGCCLLKNFDKGGGYRNKLIRVNDMSDKRDCMDSDKDEHFKYEGCEPKRWKSNVNECPLNTPARTNLGIVEIKKEKIETTIIESKVDGGTNSSDVGIDIGVQCGFGFEKEVDMLNNGKDFKLQLSVVNKTSAKMDRYSTQVRGV